MLAFRFTLGDVDSPGEVQQRARALGDPSRFRLFEYIRNSTDEVPVAKLTELLGFNHNAIRQHLNVLVEAGLVIETDEKRTTRGRPRKLYSAREDAFSAFGADSAGYKRLADLLLELSSSDLDAYSVGFEHSTRSNPPMDEDGVVEAVAVELQRGGFEPVATSPSMITLGRCPFADLATKNPGIVCELHRGLIDGQIAATGMVSEFTTSPPT